MAAGGLACLDTLELDLALACPVVSESTLGHGLMPCCLLQSLLYRRRPWTVEDEVQREQLDLAIRSADTDPNITSLGRYLRDRHVDSGVVGWK